MRKGTLVFLTPVFLAFAGLAGLALWPKSDLQGGVSMRVQLQRGPLTIFKYPSRRATTSALILFGSGDGGWEGLERSICHALQEQGYCVAGIDSTVYAQSDYSLDTLQSDYAKIAEAVRGTIKGAQPPLIIGGYSMGAAQAIAAAGGPNPPRGLVGLLVVDPLSRGRYGLRESDQLNVLPEGPGTFSTASFAPAMNGLHVVQWHAENDEIDSQAWLAAVPGPHLSLTFDDAGHTYSVNRAQFVHELAQSVPWILDAGETGNQRTAANR